VGSKWFLVKIKRIPKRVPKRVPKIVPKRVPKIDL
jgi:hypothetical protein